MRSSLTATACPSPSSIAGLSILMEPRAGARIGRQRAEDVVAAVRRERGHTGPAQRQVAVEALALEVVAEVLTREQEREAVLEVGELLQLAVLGTAVEREAGRQMVAGIERLL